MGCSSAIPKCFLGILYLPAVTICHTPSSLSFQLYARYGITLVGFCLLYSYTCWPVFILKAADWRWCSLPLEWKVISFMVDRFPCVDVFRRNPQKAQSPASMLERSVMPSLECHCHFRPFVSTSRVFLKVTVTVTHTSLSCSGFQSFLLFWWHLICMCKLLVLGRGPSK